VTSEASRGMTLNPSDTSNEPETTKIKQKKKSMSRNSNEKITKVS
jgi:hypothetical protein